jgi:hypothetical protein
VRGFSRFSRHAVRRRRDSTGSSAIRAKVGIGVADARRSLLVTAARGPLLAPGRAPISSDAGPIRFRLYLKVTVQLIEQETIMKTILSALVALTVLASVAAPASAAWYNDEGRFDARAFFEDLQNHSG